jgi:uncharacterized protein (DUF2384 family)
MRQKTVKPAQVKVPASIMKLAIQVHGSRFRAQRWLKLPKHRFAGLTPIQRLKRPNGEKALESALKMLQKGTFKYV